MHEEWAAKFWQRVDRSGGPDACWLWTGSREKHGYGWLYPRRKLRFSAHRMSWEIANGREAPRELDVMHSCDNPPCVNPAHLSPGTHKENAVDAQDKGRMRPPGLAGERHPNHKLSAAQVTEIRARLANGEPRSSIVRAFAVSKGTIDHIASGFSWREPRPPLSLRFNLARELVMR